MKLQGQKQLPRWGECNSENVVYQATILPKENETDKKIYIGISAGNWKQRLYNHRHSFTQESLRNQTALSKIFWRLKEKGLNPLIEWKLLKKIDNTEKLEWKMQPMPGRKDTNYKIQR